MRIWSIHPKYLDAKGIVALWREALLARNVLEGNTRDPDRFLNLSHLTRVEPHPLFRVIEGGIEEWELVPKFHKFTL